MNPIELCRWISSKKSKPPKEISGIIKRDGKLYDLSKCRLLAKTNYVNALLVTDKGNYFELYFGGAIADLDRNTAMSFWKLNDHYYAEYDEVFNAKYMEM